MAKQQTNRLAKLEERYAGYKVYDRDGEEIGKVDDLFVNDDYQPEYIGLKMGFLGAKSALIPMDIVREDQELRAIEVSQPKSKIVEGPTLGDDEEFTPEYEERVRKYYGLGRCKGPARRGAYGTYQRGEREEGVSSGSVRKNYIEEKTQSRKHYGEIGHDVGREDTEAGQFRGYASEQEEGLHEASTDLREAENELKVQRAEEELVAGTREREVGGVHVRKRVRSDREQVRVPKRREEVHVDRVTVNREAPEGEIGEEEFFVPVVEEEVIVETHPVAKEEIRLRKGVVEEEEVVERDVRKEEVDIDDQTEHRAGPEHGSEIASERGRRSA